MTPDATPPDPHVARLRIYPVKGARGTDLELLELDEIGPRFDRRWMVVRPDGTFVTQRQLPALATVLPRLTGSALTLEAPGAEPISVPIDGRTSPLSVQVWQSTLEARTTTPEADQWLSSVLGTPLRLVYMADGDVRETNPDYAEGHRVSFADGYPSLLVGQASGEEVSRRAGRPIPLERFRPNVVVAGTAPHDEDRWRRLSIGGIEFRGVKLCARCKVTTVDQETGGLDTTSEPLRTLARYRQIEGQVYFGLNAVYLGAGRIALGDPVVVLERGSVPGHR